MLQTSGSTWSSLGGTIARAYKAHPSPAKPVPNALLAAGRVFQRREQHIRTDLGRMAGSGHCSKNHCPCRWQHEGTWAMPFVIVSLSVQRERLSAIARRLSRARLVLSAESCRWHKRMVAFVWTYLGKADQQCLCKPQHGGVWVTEERRGRSTSNTATDATCEATCNEDLNAVADTVQTKGRGIVMTLFHCAPKQGTRADRPQRPVSMLAPCALPHRIPRRKRQSGMALVAGTMMHHCLLTPAPPPGVSSQSTASPFGRPSGRGVVGCWLDIGFGCGHGYYPKGCRTSCTRPQSRHRYVDICIPFPPCIHTGRASTAHPSALE